MAGKLDARAKLASTLCALFLVASTPFAAWNAFAAYGAVTLLLLVFSGISVRPVVTRVLTGIPFILLAVLLMSLTQGWERGITILLKGTLALILLSLLILSTEISSLIGAIRKLGAPEVINLIAAMMLRYVAMLTEEFQRMSRARSARAGAPLSGIALFQIHGNQAGLLLVRSWERAERIHNAMLSRGFTGTMPELRKEIMNGRDWLFTAIVITAFGSIRLFLD